MIRNWVFIFRVHFYIFCFSFMCRLLLGITWFRSNQKKNEYIFFLGLLAETRRIWQQHLVATHLSVLNAFGKWRWKSGTWLVAIDKQQKGAGLEPKALPFKPGHSYCAHAQKPFRFLRGSICCACDSSPSVVHVVPSWRRLDQKGLPPQLSKTGRALIASRLPGYTETTTLPIPFASISLVSACLS